MNQRMKSFLLSITPIVLIIIAAYYIIPVSYPVILAILTAFMIDGLVQFTMRIFHLSRKWSVAALHIAFFSIAILLTYFIITILLQQLIALSKALPEHFNTLFTLYIDLQTKVFNWTNDWPIEVVKMLQINLQEQLLSLIKYLTQLTTFNTYSPFALAIPDVFFTLFVYFTVLYLVQIELPLIAEKLLKPFKPNISKKLVIISKELKEAVWGFFKAQIIISFIISIIALPALYVILPGYALLLTLAISFIDSIPFLDSFFLLAPLAIIFFTTGQNHLAISLLILGIALMLVRRILEPKLLGNHFNLPTLPTFIAMFIGLELFGIIGLLAGPLAVILIRSLIKQKVIHFEKK